MSYRKREIAHWNQGKAYKGSRKAKERDYALRDIQGQIDEQDPSFRYPRYSRKRNELARAEYRVKWYELMVTRYTGPKSIIDSWMQNGLHDARARLNKLRAQKEESK